MRILIASKIDPATVAELTDRHDVECVLGPSETELRRLVADIDALVFRSGLNVSREVLEVAPRLGLVVRAGSGFDNIDLDELARREITFVRIPRPAAQSVAELTFAHLLALARDLRTADASMRRGEWLKNDLEGVLLHGKTLGVVGLGNIGQRVAEMAVAWGMDVVGCVEQWTTAEAERLAAGSITLALLDDVLAASDFMTVHVPLQESTVGLIGTREIARMKPGAILLSLARGGVVDEGALYEALVTGHLRGAGLDVHVSEGPGQRSPFRDLPNVVLTPHVGSSTVDTQRLIGAEILAAVRAFEERLAGRPDVAACARH